MKTILILILCVSLSACGSKPESTETNPLTGDDLAAALVKEYGAPIDKKQASLTVALYKYRFFHQDQKAADIKETISNILSASPSKSNDAIRVTDLYKIIGSYQWDTPGLKVNVDKEVRSNIDSVIVKIYIQQIKP